ncbi:class I SAM-dependent methyltransferase [Streptomyces sp. HNM0575]|uniref:class I SAM-dependent methyltransferase n=1 Tax=Streptomyces sp. HNM0575 TaxID=2716338 RepID=UPI00145DFAA3|nr:class I SAM-dependent methyltransferase [Streptomyces sp. HNM0575]NLU76086.1 class I SAM-dependent methyltransferase [Streptomyces sp. HNM0575]
MTEDPAGRPPDIYNVDFDAIYQGEPLVEGVKTDRPPWDIEQAQPAVKELEGAGRLFGEVLDIGCGLGDNAIFLAAQGHRVTALDGSPTAIRKAEERARAQGAEVDFAVADATELAGYEGRFDSVLDSALYHCLDDEQRLRYTAALHRVAKPDALLNILCFCDDSPTPIPDAMTVPEDNIRSTLAATGWDITDLRRTIYAGAANVGELAANVGKPAGDEGGEAVLDENGHVSIPMWVVQARRG